MTDDAAVIRALTAEFVSAFNEGDVDRMMRLYSGRYVDINLPKPEQTHRERAEYYRHIVTRRGRLHQPISRIREIAIHCTSKENVAAQRNDRSRETGEIVPEAGAGRTLVDVHGAQIESPAPRM